MEGLLSTGPTPSNFDDNNIEEQCFMANIRIENLKQKKELEKIKLL